MPRSSRPSVRALIVHPRFVHTLAAQPEPTWTRLTILSDLPMNALMTVASHLDAQALCSFEAVSQHCRSVACGEELWREQCINVFNVSRNAGPPPKGWKALYRFNHEVLYEYLLHASAEGLKSMGMQRAGGVGGNAPVVINVLA